MNLAEIPICNFFRIFFMYMLIEQKKDADSMRISIFFVYMKKLFTFRVVQPTVCMLLYMVRNQLLAGWLRCA
jgi:hypothetical protein